MKINTGPNQHNPRLDKKSPPLRQTACHGQK